MVPAEGFRNCRQCPRLGYQLRFDNLPWAHHAGLPSRKLEDRYTQLSNSPEFKASLRVLNYIVQLLRRLEAETVTCERKARAARAAYFLPSLATSLWHTLV